MWAWKVAPALAAGCCVIMKPSELTPLTALMLCDLAKEAGIPAGVINTLPGLGVTTGDALSRHMDIDKIAFTGSVITGRRIAIAAAESNLKKVTLELGGKSPMVVFDSADIEEAATWTALGIWFNSGQDCCASSRVLVQDTIYDKFLEALKRKAEACAIGQVSQPHQGLADIFLISLAARREDLVWSSDLPDPEGQSHRLYRVWKGGRCKSRHRWTQVARK
jgi:aldehyde dehydrogenase (NAD+)